MALLDFKIQGIKRDGRNVSATVCVYRGAITSELEGAGDDATIVTRYRRIALVARKTFSYTVPRDMTKEEFLHKARQWFRKKLNDIATAGGHTIITAQQDFTDYEPFLNETET